MNRHLIGMRDLELTPLEMLSEIGVAKLPITRNWYKTNMTPKMIKARKRTKAQRLARKINRKK